MRNFTVDRLALRYSSSQYPHILAYNQDNALCRYNLFLFILYMATVPFLYITNSWISIPKCRTPQEFLPATCSDSQGEVKAMRWSFCSAIHSLTWDGAPYFSSYNFHNWLVKEWKQEVIWPIVILHVSFQSLSSQKMRKNHCSLFLNTRLTPKQSLHFSLFRQGDNQQSSTTLLNNRQWSIYPQAKLTNHTFPSACYSF